MFQRASASWPSTTARSIFLNSRVNPSSAIASIGGLIKGEQNVSTQCESASIPVAAVMYFGSDRVKSGSQMATLTIVGQPTPALMPLLKMMTAERPTSLPLPEVVGIKIKGGG